MHRIRFERFLKPMLRRLVWPIRRPLVKVLNASGAHYCPVCENRVRRFMPYGSSRRANASCPFCGSLERHRLDWLFLKERTNLFDGSRKKMLHVAPEKWSLLTHPWVSRREVIHQLDHVEVGWAVSTPSGARMTHGCVSRASFGRATTASGRPSTSGC